MECKKLFLPLLKLSRLLILQSRRQTTTIGQLDLSIRDGHFRATKFLTTFDLIQLKMLWFLIYGLELSQALQASLYLNFELTEI